MPTLLTVNDLLCCGLVTFRLHVAGHLVDLAGELVALLLSPCFLSVRLDCSLYPPERESGNSDDKRA